MTDAAFSALPPVGPPPLLSAEELVHLGQQGWVEIPLPESLKRALSDLLEHSVSFFKEPPSVKRGLFPQGHGTEFGYYEVEDEKEYVTFRCHNHLKKDIESAQSASILETNAARTWHEAGLLLYRILCDIARASELDVNVWDDILDGTLQMPHSQREMTHTLMRIFQYLPTTGHATEHTDMGLLTMCVGDREGLQVLDRAQTTGDQPSWITSEPGISKATILVGQTLKLLSQGSLNAGIHRVVGKAEGRNSIVYALRHSTKHDVDVAKFGGDGRIPPQDLYRVMGIGKVNVNIVKVTRDEQLKNLASEHDHRVTHSQG